VGSITTAVTTVSGSITAASIANPAEFTTGAEHELANGDEVEFDGMPGDWAPLNTGPWVVTVTAPTKFTVTINSTAFAAYTSGGTFVRIAPDTDGGGGSGWDPRTAIP
jgi:hypothetical protein